MEHNFDTGETIQEPHINEKPLCGYCYNECTDDCCDKRRIDVLERKLAEAREVQNKLGEWVHQYIHCMRTVDYCGSLEEANEMGQYLEQLKEQS